MTDLNAKELSEEVERKNTELNKLNEKIKELIKTYSKFIPLACKSGTQGGKRPMRKQRGGTEPEPEELMIEKYIRGVLCSPFVDTTPPPASELLGAPYFLNILLSHLAKPDMIATVKALRVLNKSTKAATTSFAPIDNNYPFKTLVMTIAIVMEQIRRFFAHDSPIVTNMEEGDRDALPSPDNKVVFEVNMVMENNDIVYMIWTVDDFKLDKGFTTGSFRLEVEGDEVSVRIDCDDDDDQPIKLSQILRDEYTNLDYDQGVYNTVCKVLSKFHNMQWTLKPNLNGILTALKKAHDGYVMDTEVFEYDDAYSLLAIVRDIIRLTLNQVQSVTDVPPIKSQAQQVSVRVQEIKTEGIVRRAPRYYLRGNDIDDLKKIFHNKGLVFVTYCVNYLNRMIKRSVSKYFAIETTLGEWKKKRDTVRDALYIYLQSRFTAAEPLKKQLNAKPGTEEELKLQKELVKLFFPTQQVLERELEGKLPAGFAGGKPRHKVKNTGAKANKAIYTPTTHTHIAKDGIRRKVYSKNGKHYIKRKVDNKFVYRLVRAVK
jgi:hypothetical protein